MSDKKRCQSWSSTGVKFNLNEIERKGSRGNEGIVVTLHLQRW